MANFLQAIIDKVTGHKEDAPPAAGPAVAITPLALSHITITAAAAADSSAQAAKDQADQAEVAAQVAAAPDPAAAQQVAAAVQDAQKQRDADAAAVVDAVVAAADQFEIIKEHTLTYDDTLSGLALHFYGHATPEYWGLIILANKAQIGGAVRDYTPGKVIKIPVLPEELKK